MRNMVRELKYGASTLVSRARANPAAAVVAASIDIALGVAAAAVILLVFGGGSC